ncbi:MAG TPA: hypothetical protein VHN37_09935 [Actinomycetota bacterium]|nr:hypothetical protein [Actinomycetota bacterium]
MSTKVAIALLGFFGTALGSVVLLPEPWNVTLAAFLVVAGMAVAFRSRASNTTTRSRVHSHGRTIEKTRYEKRIEVAAGRRKWTFTTISSREKIVGVVEDANEERIEREREPERPNLGA